jgi:antigen flippase
MRTMTARERNRADEEGRGRHLAGSILSVGASRGASLAAIALASVVVARILGPAGTGTFAIAHALLFAFTVLCELGMPQALAYYAGRDEWSGRPLARDAILASFLLALPGSAAMVAGFALIGDSVPGMTWPMAVGLAAALPFSLLWRIGPQAALADERFEAFAALDAAPALLLCPASILGAALGGTDGAIGGLVLATIAGGVTVIGWLLTWARHEGPNLRPAGGARGLLRFGLPAWGSELLMQLNLRVDLILVGAYAGAGDGGVYSVALSTTSIAWTVMAAFAVSALPRSARLQARSERAQIDLSERHASDARVTRHAVLAMPAVGAAIALLLIVAVPILYGEEFERSVELGLILLPGSLLLGLGTAAVAILLAGGEAGRVIRTGLAVVPATVVAYLLAIPAGGATAAAIVASISYAAFTAIAIAELRAASGTPLSELVLPRRADLADYAGLASAALTRLGGGRSAVDRDERRSGDDV